MTREHPASEPVRRGRTGPAILGTAVPRPIPWLIPCLLLGLLVGRSSPGLAADPKSTAPPPPSATGETVEEGEDLLSKLTVHGFLSLAWGLTDGHQLVGLTGEGTGDYRTAALQLRFAATERDVFVVQFDHERIGDSPAMDFHDEAELDWLFYERRLGDATALRIGRVVLPMGIYNEIQDVGTVLPFYRPPVSVTNETTFTTETVDGVRVSHGFQAGSPWRLTLDGYAGECDMVEISGGLQGQARFHDILGFQAWLHTPVPRLRLGLAGQSGVLTGGPLRPTDFRDDTRILVASVDYGIGPLTVRSEAKGVHLDTATFIAVYLELGGQVTRRFSLHALGQRGDLELRWPYSGRLDMDRELALGARYAFNSQLVAKAEVHWNRSYRTEDPVALTEPLSTRYGILSLAMTF